MFLLIAAFFSIPVAMGQQPPVVNLSNGFAPNKCGPADPSYIHTANETGGIPLFLQRSEAVKAMQFVRQSIRDNVSTVLWASAKLADPPQDFTVPVDATTGSIAFTFSVDTKGTRLILREPNGQEITQSSPAIEDTELNCGRIITVEKPHPGIWRAQVTGSGTYWLAAKAQSEINFITAEFVELRGRPGHQGLFRIYGQPIAGEPARLRVELLEDEVNEPAFVLVNERGDVIQRVGMKADENDSQEFFGEVKLPDRPFRVAVTGRDARGFEFQRLFAPLFHAETVEVTPRLDFDELAAGDQREAVFAVRNFGPERNFRITVTDARRLVTGFEPHELTMNAHGAALVHIHLAVPAASSKIFEDNLVIVVASVSGPPTTNSAVVRLTVKDNPASQNAH